MNITFTGHGIDLTDALKEAATQKFSKLSRHDSHLMKAHITFSVQKLSQKIEASLSLPGTNIHAKSESTDNMYVAIDDLVGKLDKQIVKHKQKNNDNHHHRDRE